MTDITNVTVSLDANDYHVLKEASQQWWANSAKDTVFFPPDTGSFIMRANYLPTEDKTFQITFVCRDKQ